MGQTLRRLAAVIIGVSLFSAGALSAQEALDSLLQDSMSQVILSEEVATSIPSDFAELNLQISRSYWPRLNEANSFITDPKVKKWHRKLRDLSLSTQYALERNEFSISIESLIPQWEKSINDLTEYADLLKSQSDGLVEFKKEIATERAKWKRNKESSVSVYPPEIVSYMDRAIDTLNFFLSQTTSSIDTIIVTYSRLVDLHLESQNYIESLQAVKQRSVDSLLITSTTPIWRTPIIGPMEIYRDEIEYYQKTSLSDTRLFLSQNKRPLLMLGVYLLAILAVILWARRKSKEKDSPEASRVINNEYVLRSPYSMATLMVMIIFTFTVPIEPPLLHNMVRLVFIFMSASILSIVFDKQYRWVIWTLLVVYVFHSIVQSLGGVTPSARWLSLMVGIVLLWSMTKLRIQTRTMVKDSRDHNSWGYLFDLSFYPLYLATIFGIGANIFGYGNMAMVANRGVINTLLIAWLLGAVYDTLITIIYHFFNTGLAQRSNIIREGKSQFFKHLKSYVEITLYALLFYYSMTFFMLWDPLLDGLRSIWLWGYNFGNVEVTVGGLITLFLVISIFWIIGATIRLILNKEVFTRINLPRGVGNAISSVVQYTLVVVGFFMALADAGLELAHLGILAGALGVGIGIGLQSIINNFISGLILVFERPVAVGDTIEVDQELGVVTTIGIRSSTMMLFNGDEVIIPNADFISKKVTNRTLTDTKRRFTLRFETARDVDPEQVLKAITEAAQQAPGVIANPPVEAFFEGMKGQALEFYVNYWGVGNFLDLKSNVEQAVYGALKASNVPMYVPVAVEIQRPDE